MNEQFGVQCVLMIVIKCLVGCDKWGAGTSKEMELFFEMSIRGAEQTNSSSLKAILQPIFCIDSKYTNCNYTNWQEVKNYIKFIKIINKIY